MSETLFELADVVVAPDGVAVLDGIRCTIPAGGVTAIAGPSGAGKTSLLRLLNRLDVPASGRISFRGAPIESYEPTALRREVGMIFQRPAIFPGTVLDNLRQAGPGLTEEDAADLCRRVELDPALLQREASALSGGEAQRMAFARALVNRPTVLLADEPTAALDAAPRRGIEALVKTLAGQGMTLVWVSHDAAQLRRVADRAIVLAGGRVVAVGEVAELLSNPDPHVRAALLDEGEPG